MPCHSPGEPDINDRNALWTRLHWALQRESRMPPEPWEFPEPGWVGMGRAPPGLTHVITEPCPSREAGPPPRMRGRDSVAAEGDATETPTRSALSSISVCSLLFPSWTPMEEASGWAWVQWGARGCGSQQTHRKLIIIGWSLPTAELLARPPPSST